MREFERPHLFVFVFFCFCCEVLTALFFFSLCTVGMDACAYRLCGDILSSRAFTWEKMSLRVIAKRWRCFLSNGMLWITFATILPPLKNGVSLQNTPRVSRGDLPS